MVAKGKKVVRFAMKDGPSDEELLKHLMGPTGNLRAPAIVVGKKLLIGFTAEAYEPVFGS
ncbi:MAG: hypothetical protein H6834_11995 [Planctomycetes bacterium]|nr:hypothetical protein [Planctomycetota bacterium]